MSDEGFKLLISAVTGTQESRQSGTISMAALT